MKILRRTSLYHEPAKQYVEATIVRLASKDIDAKIDCRWWNDTALKDGFDPAPIDLHWDWHSSMIDYEGHDLPAEKIGITAGDNADVQGIMMISTVPVPSVLEAGKQALFVERLFTAPWNRRDLRRDGKNFLKAVGLELLTWGAWNSRAMGHHGRLLLDASPDFVLWYEQKCHLQRLNRPPILFEGLHYTPMELPASGAQRLLDLWEDV